MKEVDKKIKVGLQHYELNVYVIGGIINIQTIKPSILE
jgi:hypothetical protein